MTRANRIESRLGALVGKHVPHVVILPPRTHAALMSHFFRNRRVTPRPAPLETRLGRELSLPEPPLHFSYEGTMCRVMESPAIRPGFVLMTFDGHRSPLEARLAISEVR